MKILVFAKRRQTKDGRAFTAYVSKLTKKDGSFVTTGVKFREECGAPNADDCPCYIEVNKSDCNFNVKEVTIKDPDTGEETAALSNTLWISAWTKSAEEYVDHSMDDFED